MTLGLDEWWKPYWKSMPEFVQEDLSPWRTVEVRFKDDKAIRDFSNKIGQKITKDTKFVWHPKSEQANLLSKCCKGSSVISPRYPIYIISKGRWESRQTSKYLEKILVPYHIVIEPQEYDNYASVIDPNKILMLPFSNLGRGSIPARNWIWMHSVKTGFKRHWILDDNILEFYRLNRNIKYRVNSGAIFRVIEDFADRYENMGLAGMQYELLCPRKVKVAPFYLNTRIYSCILIDNSLPFRWRGKYNEDTDLSLRCLKSGKCTVLFNAFLANKTATMRMKGGNTDELYKQDDKFDGRLEMAESLTRQHPDYCRVIWKWGRWQHHVDYKRFKYNFPILKSGIIIPEEINEYGMELIDLNQKSSRIAYE
jgi:hypothetical protein